MISSFQKIHDNWKVLLGLKMKPPRARKPRNDDVRPREWLVKEEIDRLMKTAKKQGRHGLRNATMILFAFQHGLRVAELVNLKYSQLDFGQKSVHVLRRKNGRSNYHPFWKSERTAIAKIKKLYPSGKYVFVSERKEKAGKMTESNFWKILRKLAKEANFEIPNIHPHMLRHSCSNHLKNVLGKNLRDIQEYLGHRDIRNTERYTPVSMESFREFF